MGLVGVATRKPAPDIIRASRIGARVIAPFAGAKESDVVIVGARKLRSGRVRSNLCGRPGWTVQVTATKIHVVEVNPGGGTEASISIHLRIIEELAAVMVIVFRFPSEVIRLER